MWMELGVCQFVQSALLGCTCKCVIYGWSWVFVSLCNLHCSDVTVVVQKSVETDTRACTIIFVLTAELYMVFIVEVVSEIFFCELSS